MENSSDKQSLRGCSVSTHLGISGTESGNTVFDVGCGGAPTLEFWQGHSC